MPEAEDVLWRIPPCGHVPQQLSVLARFFWLFSYLVRHCHWFSLLWFDQFSLLVHALPSWAAVCPGSLGAVHFRAKCAKGRALFQCSHAPIHAPQSNAGQHLETICALDVFEFEDFWLLVLVAFHVSNHCQKFVVEALPCSTKDDSPAWALRLVSWQTLRCLAGMPFCLVAGSLS